MLIIEPTKGGDWEDFGIFYAQRGDGGRFSFGDTEQEALFSLLQIEGRCGFCGYHMGEMDRYGCPNCFGEGLNDR